ncbi:MAG: hypothetical protein ACUVUE_04290 [Candidatus Bathycorpusculaceae bacterium]
MEKAELVKIMQDFDIVHSGDLLREEASLRSDITYDRLFYKGNYNTYSSLMRSLRRPDQRILKVDRYG